MGLTPGLRVGSGPGLGYKVGGATSIVNPHDRRWIHAMNEAADRGDRGDRGDSTEPSTKLVRQRPSCAGARGAVRRGLKS